MKINELKVRKQEYQRSSYAQRETKFIKGLKRDYHKIGICSQGCSSEGLYGPLAHFDEMIHPSMSVWRIHFHLRGIRCVCVCVLITVFHF